MSKVKWQVQEYQWFGGLFRAGTYPKVYSNKFRAYLALISHFLNDPFVNWRLVKAENSHA